MVEVVVVVVVLEVAALLLRFRFDGFNLLFLLFLLLLPLDQLLSLRRDHVFDGGRLSLLFDLGLKHTGLCWQEEERKKEENKGLRICLHLKSVLTKQ